MTAMSLQCVANGDMQPLKIEIRTDCWGHTQNLEKILETVIAKFPWPTQPGKINPDKRQKRMIPYQKLRGYHAYCNVLGKSMPNCNSWGMDIGIGKKN